MKSNRSRLLFVVGSIAALLSIRAVSNPSAKRDPATRALAIFSDVLGLTRQNYVEPVETRALLQGSYDGMSDALDAFSYYVPASERAAYRAQEGAGAISPGIVLARRGGLSYVVAPLPGSPAEKAGVKSGDLIDTIDGKQVRNSPLWKVKAALEGPEGTHVELLMFRGGDERRVKVQLTRARFQAPAPSTRWERDVAIVRIPTFSEETAAALRQAAEEASRRSITRMIVDLRGTIGGEIAEAAPAAAVFTGKGTVAKVVSRRAMIAPLEAGTERIWKGRTVILTDDATGGPAEVFAAAVHDRADGTTVGETTVGMAIVQRPVPTEAGGILYMTVGRYVSPSGAVLGGRGLNPDEKVLVFPGESDAKDPILTRGLEVVRGASLSRHAA
ncbi:MAG TPA: S41 family peptidase [Thermoanaerobaculia bacterium]|nr:S41 family peptidase [Thermoanaerobaculia bacterium]